MCEGMNGKEVNEFSMIEDDSEYPSPGHQDVDNFRNQNSIKSAKLLNPQESTPDQTIYGDEMEEYKFDVEENSDEEIEELAKTKSNFEHEAGLVFSKRGIIEFIEKMLQTESVENKDANGKLWEEKSKTPNFKFYMKNIAGTAHFLRQEAIFNKKYKLQKFLKVLYNPEEKVKHDSNLVHSEILEIRPGVKCIGLAYSKNKKTMNFSERDFYEKYVHFFHEGKYYRLSSSCYRQLETENENGEKFELD